MANTYVFANPQNNVAIRSDGANIAWDVANNQPTDIRGLVGKTWKRDGSPIPAAYTVPVPSAEDIRTAQFNNDNDRQIIVNNLKDKTPDEIKTFINNNATDLAGTKQMLLRLTLLCAKTLRD